MHKSVHVASLLGRSTDVVPLLSGKGGRPEVGNGQKFDRWPVDRKVNSDHIWLPTAVFLKAYKKGFLGLFSTTFLRAFIFYLTSVFAAIQKKFLSKKFDFFICVFKC